MSWCWFPSSSSIHLSLCLFFVLTADLDLWPRSARGAQSADSLTFLLYHRALHLSWRALRPDSELPQRDPWTFSLILPALSGRFCLCPPVVPWGFTPDSCARSPAQRSAAPTHQRDLSFVSSCLSSTLTLTLFSLVSAFTFPTCACTSSHNTLSETKSLVLK